MPKLDYETPPEPKPPSWPMLRRGLMVFFSAGWAIMGFDFLAVGPVYVGIILLALAALGLVYAFWKL